METLDRVPLVYKFRGKEMKHVDWAESVHSIQSSVKMPNTASTAEERRTRPTTNTEDFPKVNF